MTTPKPVSAFYRFARISLTASSVAVSVGNLLYEWAQKLGCVMSEAQWEQTGGSHLYDDALGGIPFFLFFLTVICLFLLALASAVYGLATACITRRGRYLLVGAALAAAHIALLCALFRLEWLFD